MKITSARGSLLLHVTGARLVKRNKYGAAEVFYSWTGKGCGGYGPALSLSRTIAAIIEDSPRAKSFGELPDVKT